MHGARDDTRAPTIIKQMEIKRKSTFEKHEDFVYLLTSKRVKKTRVSDMETAGMDGTPDEKLLEEVIDYVNSSSPSKI